MNQIDSILVTGGTGSFGRAFIDFLLNSTSVSRIVCYSRGEHAQAALRLALHDEPRMRWMIGDVRDESRLKRAMDGVDTVVHAAALKRIEVGQYNPEEMIKTNVLGTMNVIHAAIDTRVRRVVGLSSDKAYQPISPYGQSKALAESLLLAANTIHGSRGTRFACTRYGNIWKAQGSVVPHWQAMIAHGAKTVPVTDPNCTRFFMTIEQAVDLVWTLAREMEGGELVIPDWLHAYRLGDLAYAMGVKADVIGLPAWEKKHESMRDGCSSDKAMRMMPSELREWLK